MPEPHTCRRPRCPPNSLRAQSRPGFPEGSPDEAADVCNPTTQKVEPDLVCLLTPTEGPHQGRPRCYPPPGSQGPAVNRGQCPISADGHSDTASVETAPADAAPVDTPSVDTAPVDTASVEAAPVDAAPVGTPSVDAAPVDTAPVDAAPMDTASVEAAPADAAPVDTPSVDAAPMDSASMDTPQGHSLRGGSPRGRSPRGHTLCGRSPRACPQTGTMGTTGASSLRINTKSCSCLTLRRVGAFPPGSTA
uniref:Uncharacterized protein n=1 Tax=Rangifer tarandus platyrhynchus TaxID=3082113 RepID=A0ACB0ETK1_RANTA|nr:unnamed protein product [Rangifer tarandus platyrhynchus]